MLNYLFIYIKKLQSAIDQFISFIHVQHFHLTACTIDKSNEATIIVFYYNC